MSTGPFETIAYRHLPANAWCASPASARQTWLDGVAAASARNAWAVGAAGATGSSTPNTLILRWSGTAWK
jgi:hypothetical protein